jgi:excisionase family DNA binding protein
MVRTVFVEEAARLLGVSRRTVYYRIRQGKLVTVKTPGGSSRVLVDSISALLREELARRRASVTPTSATADNLSS